MPVLVIAVMALSLLSESGQHKKQPEDPKKHADSTISPGSQISLVIDFSSGDDAERNKAEKDSRSAQDQPRYWGLTFAEWIQDGIAFALAVITAFYVGITGKMFGKIKEQAVIMRQQVDNAADQLRLMEGSIHVDGVQAIELEEGKAPIFFVKVVNSGMVARLISITMEINIGESVSKYDSSVAMMIPAHGEREFFIPADTPIGNGMLQKLDGRVCVRGSIAWEEPQKDAEEYCYKYNPCSLIVRPDGYPQFVPCDFSMARHVGISGRADGKSTVTGTPTALEKPSDETKQAQQSKTKNDCCA